MRLQWLSHRCHRSYVRGAIALLVLTGCGANSSAVPSVTPTAAVAPTPFPPPPTHPTPQGGIPTAAATPTSLPSMPLPTPRTPPAITLMAMSVAGAAPFTVTFTVTIPAGVGTGCEADVYEYGDGQRLGAFIPCGIVITPAAPGVTPTPFVLPTWPPRKDALTSVYTHAYEHPGTFVAQFALSEKPSDRIIAVSNIVTITVT